MHYKDNYLSNGIDICDFVVINQICSENVKKGKKKQDLLVKLDTLGLSHFWNIIKMIYVITFTLWSIQVYIQIEKN